MGMHKEGKNNNDKGLFLSYPNQKYIKLYTNNLEEFNKKYNLNIQQDATKIDLGYKHIGNEGLKDLCKIEFKELKELYLYENNRADIKVLEKIKFAKLELL